METKHYDASGAAVGTVELNPAMFGVEPNTSVIHQAVVGRLANERQGTASTKGRSDVNGTNRKPFRQKKTGNARRGDMKTNVLRGGGVYGGPKPRSYRKRLPKKMRRAALASALSIRANEQAVTVIADPAIESGKTRDMAGLLKALELDGKRVLMVNNKPSETMLRAAQNIPALVTVSVENLHPYEIMWAEHVLFTDSALSALTGGSES
jgi:large subunit ribosomal protein L4